MPSELSGGMARRAALARSIALDPDLIMYDEPFVGQDPITMAVLVKLIKELNDALGITSVIVTHDVKEVLSIADYAYHRQPQGGGARHTGAAARGAQSRSRAVPRKDCPTVLFRFIFRQATCYRISDVDKSGKQTGAQRCAFHQPSSAAPPSCCFTRWQANPATQALPAAGAAVVCGGVQSVAIILVSGLFIGMVLSLQGYNVLKDFGAEQSLGPLVSSPCCGSWALW
jgi:hypothetical protein